MNAILQLVLETFVHPRQIAEGITAERYDRPTLWTGFFLVIILVGIVQFAVLQVTPSPEATQDTEALVELVNNMFSSPFMTTFAIGSLLTVSVFAIYFGGQMMGGSGHFPETLALLSWLQFVNAVTGAVVVAIMAISPQLVGVAQLLNLIINIGIFYATLNFIDILHGFNSLWAAFGTMVISFIGMAVGLALILVLIGGAAAQTGAI